MKTTKILLALASTHVFNQSVLASDTESMNYSRAKGKVAIIAIIKMK